ncbi:hypothetical protein LX32DRAFT_94035 [Colletotrichum zoysiae]|uniref:Uncharacterized protein n=1 Tax=Colletotrichum zoysiae TaxID=1216348 RepID=A0AAD9LXN4_9PEZI|nr:hypothetical protein LX32DRAFT_94035 [Colletotrichum zoysiae]
MLPSGRRRCLGERLSDCLRTVLCLTQAWFPCFILMKSCRQRRRSRCALVLAVCCSSSEEVLLAPDDGSWRTCLDSLRKVWYLPAHGSYRRLPRPREDSPVLSTNERSRWTLTIPRPPRRPFSQPSSLESRVVSRTCFAS